MIEVSDLFDEYHRRVNEAWQSGGFRNHSGHQSTEYGGAYFFDVDIMLETIYFFPACALRLFEEAGNLVDPRDVRGRLVIADPAGHPLDGEAARYHSSGFDWGLNSDESVSRSIVCGDLSQRERQSVRIFIRPEGKQKSEK